MTGVPLLVVRNLRLSYGGVTALRDVDFEVAAGETLGIIGPNGAGKTSLFNCLTGVSRPQQGVILLGGKSVGFSPPHKRVRLGMARTFQNLSLFTSMTVRENIMVGGHQRVPGNLWLSGARGAAARSSEEALRTQAETLAARLELTAVLDRPLADLPYATLKRVEMARALAAKPQLLLLDEPAGGLSAPEMVALRALLVALAQTEGLAIVLVEHHMGLMLSVCERIVVLDFGTKLMEGTPRAVRDDPRVIAAYLGQQEGSARAPA